jgi:class 3 adenylate cyclase
MVTVARLQRKAFDGPDEVRRFPNGDIKIVTLDEMGVAYFTLQPGWRWSKDVAPMAGTSSCQHRHVGYIDSGAITIRMDDGTEMTLKAGDVYEIPPGHDGWVVGDEPYRAVEFASAHEYGRSAEALGERVLATVLFSDIVDSTAQLERLGDSAWLKLLCEHNERIRHVIDRHRGREIATTGDGFLALFDGATRAALAASQMGNAVNDLGLRVRVGLHTGEVEISGGQARGVAVHAAARISELAGPSEVLVSGTTHDLLEGAGLDFESRGQHELKGLTGPRPIFALKTR